MDKKTKKVLFSINTTCCSKLILKRDAEDFQPTVALLVSLRETFAELFSDLLIVVMAHSLIYLSHANVVIL